jgi:hypothetical protein
VRGPPPRPPHLINTGGDADKADPGSSAVAVSFDSVDGGMLCVEVSEPAGDARWVCA